MKADQSTVSLARLHDAERTLVTAHRGNGLGTPGIMTAAPARLVEWLRQAK